jgi:hypothetical protein
MAVQLTNNAFSLIPSGVQSTDTSLTVTAGDGAKFPALGTGDFFYLTLVSTSGTFEIVKVTARADNVMTIERSQIGTIALTFPANSRAELRATVENVFLAAGDYLLL